MSTRRVKSCSCRQCKPGRGCVRKAIERRARHKWNQETTQMKNEVLDTGESSTTLTHFGGGYTD